MRRGQTIDLPPSRHLGISQHGFKMCDHKQCATRAARESGMEDGEEGGGGGQTEIERENTA